MRRADRLERQRRPPEWPRRGVRRRFEFFAYGSTTSTPPYFSSVSPLTCAKACVQSCTRCLFHVFVVSCRRDQLKAVPLGLKGHSGREYGIGLRREHGSRLEMRLRAPLFLGQTRLRLGNDLQ